MRPQTKTVAALVAVLLAVRAARAGLARPVAMTGGGMMGPGMMLPVNTMFMMMGHMMGGGMGMMGMGRLHRAVAMPEA